jgi:hypothetical protein
MKDYLGIKVHYEASNVPKIWSFQFALSFGTELADQMSLRQWRLQR